MSISNKKTTSSGLKKSDGSWCMEYLNCIRDMHPIDLRLVFLFPIVAIRTKGKKMVKVDKVDKFFSAFDEYINRISLGGQSFKDNVGIYRDGLELSELYASLGDHQLKARETYKSYIILKTLRDLYNLQAIPTLLNIWAKLIKKLYGANVGEFEQTYERLKYRMFMNYGPYNCCNSMDPYENYARALYMLILMSANQDMNDSEREIYFPGVANVVEEYKLPSKLCSHKYDQSEEKLQEDLQIYSALLETYPINTIERFHELCLNNYDDNVYAQTELLKLYLSGATLTNIPCTQTYRLLPDSLVAQAIWYNIDEKYKRVSPALYVIGKQNGWLKEAYPYDAYSDTPYFRLYQLEDRIQTGCDLTEDNLGDMIEEGERIRDALPTSIEGNILLAELYLMANDQEKLKDLKERMRYSNLDWRVNARGYDLWLQITDNVTDQDAIQGASFGSAKCLDYLMDKKDTSASVLDKAISGYLTVEKEYEAISEEGKYLLNLAEKYLKREEKSEFFVYIVSLLKGQVDTYRRNCMHKQMDVNISDNEEDELMQEASKARKIFNLLNEMIK